MKEKSLSRILHREASKIGRLFFTCSLKRNNGLSDITKLLDEAKKEYCSGIMEDQLINVFKRSTEIGLLNKIALIFKDNNVHKSVPFLMDKITNPFYLNKSGTFLYALEGLDTQSYYEDFVTVVIERNLECREMALNILENIAAQLTVDQKLKAIKMLKSAPKIMEENKRFSREKYIDYAISLME